MRETIWSTCVRPPRLHPGDTIAVPATAGPVPLERFHAGLAILKSRYRVVYDERLFAVKGYLAGDDRRRAEELNRYLADPQIRGIVCARGGYGTMRILPALDAAALRDDPKVVVGFSDLTALLAFGAVAAGVRGVHGPTVTHLAELPAEDAAWLFRVLEDPSPLGPLPGGLQPIGAAATGSVSGPLVGGNLEVFSRLLGTPWQPPLDGAVFLVEDIGERPYRIDRTLTQLRLAGALDGVAAVVVGDLTRCDEADGSSPRGLEVVGERLATFGLPGLAGLSIGHGARNAAVPFGARCTVDFDEGRVVVEEGAVA